MRTVDPLADTVHLLAEDKPWFCTAITSVNVPGLGLVTSTVPLG